MNNVIPACIGLTEDVPLNVKVYIVLNKHLSCLFLFTYVYPVFSFRGRGVGECMRYKHRWSKRNQ